MAKKQNIFKRESGKRIHTEPMSFEERRKKDKDLKDLRQEVKRRRDTVVENVRVV